METLGKRHVCARIERENDWQSVCFVKPKHSWETWRKLKKQKHVGNYTDLVECLANMGDWKKKTEEYEREQLAIEDVRDWVILLNI